LCWFRMMLKFVFSFTGSFCLLSTSPTCGGERQRGVTPTRRPAVAITDSTCPLLTAQRTHHAPAHEHRRQLVRRQVRLLTHDRLEPLEGEYAVYADVAARLGLAIVVLEVNRVRRRERLHAAQQSEAALRRPDGLFEGAGARLARVSLRTVFSCPLHGITGLPSRHARCQSQRASIFQS
jgi:hypothetical protein